MTLPLIGLVVLIAAATLFAALAWNLRIQAERIRRRPVEAGEGPPVLFEPAARFLGLEPHREAPRGRGALLLTEGELYFERYFPRAAWKLDLDRLLKLEEAPAFKDTRRPVHRLLVLVYHEEGRTERAGFRVVDAGRWVRETGRLARLARGISTECSG